MPDKSDKSEKRALPSWMSSQEKGDTSCRTDEKKNAGNHENQSRNTNSSEASQKPLPFSRIMDGVVFALSGFVNPERGMLRSQALEMGAEYRPDWSSDCTLLVCAFPNTPKFRQVESDCGTIVSKEWISECYNQKKLVEIDPYLMHAGKPWRRNSKKFESHQDENQHKKFQGKVERRNHVKPTGSANAEVGLPSSAKDIFSPLKIREWAANDLSKTIAWLENQEEKPEPDEVKTIAAQGIMTCLQDVIESLRQNQDIGHVMEQWMFIPHVVKELEELDVGVKKGSLSKQELCDLAVTCKNIYERQYDEAEKSPAKSKKQKAENGQGAEGKKPVSRNVDYDSDQTIEMTEEEIELACKELDSKHFE